MIGPRQYVTGETGEGEWILPRSPYRPEERLEEIFGVVSDTWPLTLTAAVDMNTLYPVHHLWTSLLKSLKERELRDIVAFSHTIETDPDRLSRLREVAGEADYNCYITWLVNAPFDALPDRYREIEEALYRVARYNADVHVLMLDSSRHPIVVADIMRVLGIDSLPALVLSTEPLNPMRPTKENKIIIKTGAIDRLAKQGKIIYLINNIPAWARAGVLSKKAKWEAQIKTLIAEGWNQLKDLISVNISQ